MRLDLSSCQWEVRGYYPWIPQKERSMETGKTLDGVTDWLPARVPGGVHLALYEAGLIPHPYRDQDSLACEWVENRWWMYRTEVDTANLTGPYCKLVFEGIDYAARIYVNGRQVCRHVGMFDPVVCDITEAVHEGGRLRIGVLIEHAPDENGQIGHTSQTFTQKSRFGYHWDFGTRLVNLGIWQPCYIACEQAAALTTVQWSSDVEDGTGVVTVCARLERNNWESRPLRLCCRLHGYGFDQEQQVTLLHGEFRAVWRVPAPALWYPNGYGAQPLYQGELELLCGEEVWDRREHRFGIRSLDYRLNPDSPAGALPYTFVVNDVPLYIRGVNMTPLDHVYGDVSLAHYESMVRRMREMHVNLVRVWGGGLIEKEAFYRLCDEAGILVWQEFIQSSSGLDNVPSKRPEFLALLRRATVSALCARRSFTCLTVWSGGNELMDENHVPAGYDDENIALLRELTAQYDPQRLFLPTSAAGPEEFISEAPGVCRTEKDVCFDVHGHWNYGGDPGHYRLYGSTDSLFHSEFGCEGMCGLRSFRTWISPENQQLKPVAESAVYRHHGEWWCTFARDTKLFGRLRNVEELQQCSQWIQAEGLRFILEANRRRAGRNSGSVIWQLNEPWPNVFCTNLIDYDQTPKMAYYWSAHAYAPLTASLRYWQLAYQPGQHFQGEIHLHRDGTAALPEEISAIVCRMDGSLLHQERWSGEECDCTLLLNVPIPEDCCGLLLVRLTVRSGAHTMINEYFFGSDEEPVYAEALALPAALLSAVELDRGPDGTSRWQVANEGDVCALHVRPDCADGYDLSCEEAFTSLLPGESRIFTVAAHPAFSSGLLQRDAPTEPARIRFIAFGSEKGAADA